MSHRKTPAATSVPSPGSFQGHADKNSTTTNSSTPLLTLPQELKNRIYEFVLGGNLLHITRDRLRFNRRVPHSTKGAIKEQRFSHQICCSQISEEEAHRQFISEDGSSLYVKSIELRHSSCPSYKRKGSVVPLRMNISLLRACRQIYSEARFIPYSTNTFSFDTPGILRAFIHYLNRRGVDVNEAFRSLHLDLSDFQFTLHGWTRAFKAVIQHMTLLETIYINVDQHPLWATSHDAEQKERDMEPLLDCLAILGRIPAKSTTIVVSDQHLSKNQERLVSAPSSFITHRWTMEEKRMWVAEVKLTMEELRSFG